MNTAGYFLLRLETEPNEKSYPLLQKDIPTQPIKMKIESIAIAQEDQNFFHAGDADLPSNEPFWQRKLEKRNNVQTDSSVITVSHCDKNGKYTDTLMLNRKPFNAVPCIIIDQDAMSVLLYFRRQLFGLLFDENILATNP